MSSLYREALNLYAAKCGAQIEESCASSGVCDPTRLCDELVWRPAESIPFE